MKSFQDFINRRFQFNEESGMQPVIAAPDAENTNRMLQEIFNYISINNMFANDEFRNKFFEFFKSVKDDGLQQIIRQLESTVDVSDKNSFLDRGLGNLSGSARGTPDTPPNEQDDSQ